MPARHSLLQLVLAIIPVGGLIAGGVLFVDLQSADRMPQSLVEPQQEFTQEHIDNFVLLAEHGDRDGVEIYLRAGMKADSPNGDGSTALMGASLNGHDDIVELLLKFQADPYTTNKSGYSALAYASIHGRPETLQALKDAISPSHRLPASARVDK